MSDLLTVEEAMKILRIGRSKAYEMVRTNEMPHINIGRKVFIPRVALDKWIEDRTKGVSA